MEREITLLANPVAGRGRGRRLTDQIRGRLVDRDLSVRLVQATDAAGSEELARAAVRDGTAALVVLGGDGLAHLALQAVAGRDVPLGLIPAGTGNDLAAALGVPADPGEAADNVADAVDKDLTHQVDVARTGDRWWGSVLCAGFDSAVNERVNAMRWPRGRLRYDLAVLLEVLRLRPRPVTITLDDDRLETDVTLVAVGNGHRYGAGFHVCPHARTDDGLLDVTVVGPVSRFELVRFTPTLRRGDHGSHRRVGMRRSRTVRIEGDGITAYADGERLAALPVEAACHPGALRVLGPPPP